MNKKDINEEWQKQSEAQKREIAELRAQLASYEEVMRCAKNLVSVKGTLHNFMSIGLHADNTPAFKALEKAVRAAKGGEVVMVMQTKMAFEDMYADGSGVEYAVRYDGYDDEGRGTIEFEAIDKVSFPLKRVDWLIECLERIRYNAKNNE